VGQVFGLDDLRQGKQKGHQHTLSSMLPFLKFPTMLTL
jgi:hypothetical protein